MLLKEDNLTFYLRQYSDKIHQVDVTLSQLTKDLVDVKLQLDPERAAKLNKSLTSISSMLQSLGTAKREIDSLLLPKELAQYNKKTSQRESVDDTLSSHLYEADANLLKAKDAMLGFGYSEVINGFQGAHWFRHPSGYAIRVAGKGPNISWKHYPSGNVKEAVDGSGIDSLFDRLNMFHAPKPSLKESDDIFKVPYKRYLINQVEVAPLERYRVWADGSTAPVVVARNPKTGEWQNYNTDKITKEDPANLDVDPHVEIVRRWIFHGKPPVLNNTTRLPDTAGAIAGGQAGQKSNGMYVADVPHGRTVRIDRR